MPMSTAKIKSNLANNSDTPEGRQARAGGRGRRRGGFNTRKAKEKSSNPTTQMETLAALVFVALHGGRRPRPFGYLKQITKVRMEIGYLIKHIIYR